MTLPFSMDLLKHRVDVQRRSLTQDEYMTQTETWATIRANMKCLVVPVRARERVFMKREGVLASHTVWSRAEPGLELLERDRLIGRDDLAGRTFEITGAIVEMEDKRLVEMSVEEIK